MRRIFRAFVVLFIATACCAAAAHAEDSPDTEKILGTIGCRRALSTEGRPATLILTCDEEKVIEAIPVLQKFGMINDQLTEAYINTHNVELTGVVTLEMAVLALRDAYTQNLSLDALSFEAKIDAIDDYGHTQSQPAFTFLFSRGIFSRINWEKFSPANLAKVAKRFRFSSWYLGNATAEGQ